MATVSRFCPLVLSLSVIEIITFNEETPFIRRLIGEVSTEEEIRIIGVTAPITSHFITQCKLLAQLIFKQKVGLKPNVAR